MRRSDTFMPKQVDKLGHLTLCRKAESMDFESLKINSKCPDSESWISVKTQATSQSEKTQTASQSEKTQATSQKSKSSASDFSTRADKLIKIIDDKLGPSAAEAHRFDVALLE